MEKYQEGPRTRQRNERGVVLIATLLVVVVLSALGIGMLSLSTTDTRNTVRMGQDLQALYAADAGVENVVNQLWATYVAQDCSRCPTPKGPGEVGNVNTYLAFLTGLGVPNDGTVWTAIQNQPLVGGASIQQVNVIRTDDTNTVRLAVTSVGTAGTRQVTVNETIQIEGALFKGFDYALLANNINCIMCHARFDNVERYYNSDPSKYSTFNRVKVAALQDLMIRTTSADSIIAGTLYTTGTIRDKSGTLLSDLASTTLDGYQFDANSDIVEDAGGNPNPVDLTKATGNPLPPLANLYVDYPIEPADQVDGELPTSFPSPIEDTNGNRLVDSSEFATAAAEATGRIMGGISSGVLYGVPAGSTYTSGSLPSASTADLSGGLNQRYTGNLILVGTDAYPITINATVAVDGDVIIAGEVKGTGTILAKGNIYVVGDTTYADGTSGLNRTFGLAADGTQNALTLAAGKNIVIGDYLTTKKGDINDPTSLDPGMNTSSNPKKPSNSSFTQSELTLFNKAEYGKAQTDPSYTPRYYQLRDGDPIYRFDKPGKEHGDKYDSSFVPIITSGGDAVVSLSPAATGPGGTPWISESTLKQLWINDNNHRAAGTPFQIDGLLYSSNAVIALVRKASNAQGQMLLNGAMVAADVGVLVAGMNAEGFGLQLNYDQRVSTLLKLKDPSQVRLVRRAWNVLK
ncbi:MAG: hypothetical protein ACE5IQ_05855 [Candidatus Methylomirabilales bacterium]